MTFRTVVITGVGLVSPHGNDARTAFDLMLEGRSAVRLFDVAGSPGTRPFLGARAIGDNEARVPNAARATSDRVSLLALQAATSALMDSGLELSRIDPARVGIAVGTSLGGVTTQEAAYTDVLVNLKERLSPFTLVKVMYNGPAAQVATIHGLGGPALTYSTSCSSSSVALGEAMRQIRHGYADVMLAGGAEAPFTYVSMKAWQALHVLAPVATGRDPATACRPFSVDREGTVLGEGAAFLILEEREAAVARGARIYAELAGFGSCNDHEHLTQPSVDAQTRAMKLALVDAAMDPGSIDYINAHGTATMLNDITETEAIKAAFGRHSRNLAISSTKSMHGHLIGAAGALEAVVCIMSIDRGAVAPTAHLETVDPLCDLDYVPLRAREKLVTAAMTNSFAVGGTAAVLVFRKH